MRKLADKLINASDNASRDESNDASRDGSNDANRDTSDWYPIETLTGQFLWILKQYQELTPNIPHVMYNLPMARSWSELACFIRHHHDIIFDRYDFVLPFGDLTEAQRRRRIENYAQLDTETFQAENAMRNPGLFEEISNFMLSV